MSDIQRLIEKIQASFALRVEGDGLYETPLDKLYLYQNGRFQSEVRQLYQAHIHLCVKGNYDILVNEQTFRLSPGCVVVCLAATPMQFTALSVDNGSDPYQGVILLIDWARLSRMANRIDAFHSEADVSYEPPNPCYLYEPELNNLLTCHRIAEQLDDPMGASILCDLLLDEIYFIILSGEHGNQLREQLRQHSSLRKIAQLIEYINENVTKNLSVDTLAEMLNMSTSTFHKKFKGVMKTSPHQYIKELKLSHAKSLLEEGLLVKTVSKMIGYASTTQFSREFKRQFGCAPSLISTPLESPTTEVLKPE